MTDEDFAMIYTTPEEFLIVNHRVNSEKLYMWDEYCLISYEIEALYLQWLDAHPLLKALK